MSADLLRTILQGVTTVFVGGGLVQLLVLWVRRRSELRNLDASYITALQAGEKELRGEMKVMRQEWDDERKSLTEALEHAHRELERVRAQLARVTGDLAVANSRIEDLSRRLTHGQHPGSDPLYAEGS